jgi:N4-gp56 family major capsid protein
MAELAAGKINSLITADDGQHNYLGNPAQQKFFVLTMLKRAVPYLVLFEDAQMTHIPRQSGGLSTLGAVSFRKVAALWDPLVDGVGEPTALTEGRPPTAKDLEITEVNAYMKQYGDWIQVSDLAEDGSVDGILTHAAEALGEYEGQKLHRVMLYALEATTNTFWGDGTAGVDTDGEVTGAMKLTPSVIRKLVRTMKRNNAARFNDGFYHMIIDPFQANDLMESTDTLGNFTDMAKYTGGVAANGGYNMLTGELGKGWGVRFKEANELLTGVGAAAVKTYHSYLYGPNGFGMLDLAGQTAGRINPRTNRGVSIFSQPVNRPDKLDPLGQIGFVSTKVTFAGVVFDPIQVMKVVTSASA